MFHRVAEHWFKSRFENPTPVQSLAFPILSGGRDALLTAPTGSGKTLAAMMCALDVLVAEACEARLENRCSVLYISPLKALSNDVQRNLSEPLLQISECARHLNVPMQTIRAEVRTGDTPAKERRMSLKYPPHVLVTTPESAFILLTSESGRTMLRHVRTVIVDELHAVLGEKRGAHLALTLERLDALVMEHRGHKAQRVGLSATVFPIEAAAKLLVGSRRPMPEIVDCCSQAVRRVELLVETPKNELGAVCSNEQWDEIYDRLVEFSKSSNTMLIFVNTRRLAERVAFALEQKLGEQHVAAHHGSLSRARRLTTEQRLKAGELKAVVATGSLELGIDIGTIDLVCLIGSPRRIGTALQRIGRSGHAFGGAPKGCFFPLTRDQLIECSAIVRAAKQGVMDRSFWRDAPLDILAQQMVAICACETVGEDALWDLVQGAAPYSGMERSEFEKVLTMLAEGIATRRGRNGALLHRDGIHKRLRGRRGARLLAITSGGAIPDIASYEVRVLSDGLKVGTLDEDFAIESAAGDVFLLGTTSWRIKRVETGTVWVEDAHGAAPTVPFWLGEAPARSFELSKEVSELREEIALKLDRGEDCVAFAMEAYGLDRRGAELMRDYIAAGKAALGCVPTFKTIVAERFFDEAGGMQLVIHCPMGGRINRAFGFALRKRFCRQFDFELQAAATDDGVLLSLSPQHSFPIEAIFEMVKANVAQEVMEQAVLQAPIFRTRFRWNATRALALPRFANGRRVPAQLQRMRADDLMSAVFPEQQGCQDNHGFMAYIELPDHPLIKETLRDCLVEVADAEGFMHLLSGIERGSIQALGVQTPEPSVFSHEILNANPYAFLDDAPLEERRARAVSIRRGLPAELVERIGGLDPEAISVVIEEAAPDVRDEHELHDVLLDLIALPEEEGKKAGFEPWFKLLCSDGRALCVDGMWVAAERPNYRMDLPALIQARMNIAGPVTAAALAMVFGLDESDVFSALCRIEMNGGVLRGRFTPGLPINTIEWCERRLLSRIHRRTVETLRKAVEPVTPAELIRFLLSWQGISKNTKGHGRAGLLHCIGQLQGFELAAGAWEAHVLPARVSDYDGTWLDALCLSGEVVWGRLSPREKTGAAPRAAAISLAKRRDLDWLLSPRSLDERDEEEPKAINPNELLSNPGLLVAQALHQGGALFFDDIVRRTALSMSAVEDALWELCAHGLVTGDGFSGLRALLLPAGKRVISRRVYGDRHGYAEPLAVTGRWSLLRGLPWVETPASLPKEDRTAVIEALARQYLKRYGIVFRDLLARETEVPAWHDLLRVYRRLELAGEIRGGRFVFGFVGEQFALPEAVDGMRAIKNAPKTGEIIRLSACDPLNLAGILTPGPRIPATLGNFIVYQDGLIILDEDDKAKSAKPLLKPAQLSPATAAFAAEI